MPYNFDTLIDRRPSNSIKWHRYAPDVLPMWVADMDFRAPEPVLEALRRAIAHGIFGYEEASLSLRETVAARMQRLYNWQVTPEMVIAVPGLESGFNAAAWAVCAPEDGLLVQTPVYPPFLRVPRNVGLVGQPARLRQVNHEHTLHYEVDWEAFESAVNLQEARTRMFLLCHPHNPIGQVYSQADLTRMAEICASEDIVICSDEIHSELLLGGVQHTPMAALSPEVAAYTITLIAPSKTFNVAGLFCGFAIIPNESLRRRYQAAVERLTLHVNSLGLIAAEAALSGVCDDWLKNLRAYLTANRDFLVSYVREHLPDIRTTVPDATYLAWLDCTALLENGQIQGSPHKFFLEKARVALNDGADFGPGGEGFVRLNFGCPRQMLIEALERMSAALREST
jgi:cystathionine beta-lyase